MFPLRVPDEYSRVCASRCRRRVEQKKIVIQFFNHSSFFASLVIHQSIHPSILPSERTEIENQQLSHDLHLSSSAVTSDSSKHSLQSLWLSLSLRLYPTAIYIHPYHHLSLMRSLAVRLAASSFLFLLSTSPIQASSPSPSASASASSSSTFSDLSRLSKAPGATAAAAKNIPLANAAPQNL